MNSEWVMINGIVWLIGWPLVASPMIYLVGRIWNPGAARWAGLIALGAAWIRSHSRRATSRRTDRRRSRWE